MNFPENEGVFVLRIYREDGTFKSIAVRANGTIADAIRLYAMKTRVPSNRLSLVALTPTSTINLDESDVLHEVLTRNMVRSWSSFKLLAVEDETEGEGAKDLTADDIAVMATSKSAETQDEEDEWLKRKQGKGYVLFHHGDCLLLSHEEESLSSAYDDEGNKVLCVARESQRSDVIWLELKPASSEDLLSATGDFSVVPSCPLPLHASVFAIAVHSKPRVDNDMRARRKKGRGKGRKRRMSAEGDPVLWLHALPTGELCLERKPRDRSPDSFVLERLVRDDGEFVTLRCFRNLRYVTADPAGAIICVTELLSESALFRIQRVQENLYASRRASQRLSRSIARRNLREPISALSSIMAKVQGIPSLAASYEECLDSYGCKASTEENGKLVVDAFQACLHCIRTHRALVDQHENGQCFTLHDDDIQLIHHVTEAFQRSLTNANRWVEGAAIELIYKRLDYYEKPQMLLKEMNLWLRQYEAEEHSIYTRENFTSAMSYKAWATRCASRVRHRLQGFVFAPAERKPSKRLRTSTKGENLKETPHVPFNAAFKLRIKGLRGKYFDPAVNDYSGLQAIYFVTKVGHCKIRSGIMKKKDLLSYVRQTAANRTLASMHLEPAVLSEPAEEMIDLKEIDGIFDKSKEVTAQIRLKEKGILKKKVVATGTFDVGDLATGQPVVMWVPLKENNAHSQNGSFAEVKLEARLEFEESHIHETLKQRKKDGHKAVRRSIDTETDSEEESDEEKKMEDRPPAPFFFTQYGVTDVAKLLRRALLELVAFDSGIWLIEADHNEGTTLRTILVEYKNLDQIMSKASDETWRIIELLRDRTLLGVDSTYGAMLLLLAHTLHRRQCPGSSVEKGLFKTVRRTLLRLGRARSRDSMLHSALRECLWEVAWLGAGVGGILQECEQRIEKSFNYFKTADDRENLEVLLKAFEGAFGESYYLAENVGAMSQTEEELEQKDYFVVKLGMALFRAIDDEFNEIRLTSAITPDGVPDADSLRILIPSCESLFASVYEWDGPYTTVDVRSSEGVLIPSVLGAHVLAQNILEEVIKWTKEGKGYLAPETFEVFSALDYFLGMIDTHLQESRSSATKADDGTDRVRRSRWTRKGSWGRNKLSRRDTLPRTSFDESEDDEEGLDDCDLGLWLPDHVAEEALQCYRDELVERFTPIATAAALEGAQALMVFAEDVVKADDFLPLLPHSEDYFAALKAAEMSGESADADSKVPSEEHRNPGPSHTSEMLGEEFLLHSSSVVEIIHACETYMQFYGNGELGLKLTKSDGYGAVETIVRKRAAKCILYYTTIVIDEIRAGMDEVYRPAVLNVLHFAQRNRGLGAADSSFVVPQKVLGQLNNILLASRLGTPLTDEDTTGGESWEGRERCPRTSDANGVLLEKERKSQHEALTRATDTIMEYLDPIMHRLFRSLIDQKKNLYTQSDGGIIIEYIRETIEAVGPHLYYPCMLEFLHGILRSVSKTVADLICVTDLSDRALEEAQINVLEKSLNMIVAVFHAKGSGLDETTIEESLWLVRAVFNCYSMPTRDLIQYYMAFEQGKMDTVGHLTQQFAGKDPARQERLIRALNLGSLFLHCLVHRRHDKEAQKFQQDVSDRTQWLASRNASDRKVQVVNAVKVGWLQKEGFKNKNWQPRFVVLTTQWLSFYTNDGLTDKRSEKVLESFEVQEGYHGVLRHSDEEVQTCFALRMPGLDGGEEMINLRAGTVQEKEDWMKSLLQVQTKTAETLPLDISILRLRSQSWTSPGRSLISTFNLPMTEVLVDSYTCSLLTLTEDETRILSSVRGKLHILSRYLIFEPSSPLFKSSKSAQSAVIISTSQISDRVDNFRLAKRVARKDIPAKSGEKTNMLKIQLQRGDRYYFDGFLHKDQCVSDLQGQVDKFLLALPDAKKNRARRLSKTGSVALARERGVDFGIQKLVSLSESPIAVAVDKARESTMTSADVVEGESLSAWKAHSSLNTSYSSPSENWLQQRRQRGQIGELSKRFRKLQEKFSLPEAKFGQEKEKILFICSCQMDSKKWGTLYVLTRHIILSSLLFDRNLVLEVQDVVQAKVTMESRWGGEHSESRKSEVVREENLSNSPDGFRRLRSALSTPAQFELAGASASLSLPFSLTLVVRKKKGEASVDEEHKVYLITHRLALSIQRAIDEAKQKLTG